MYSFETNCTFTTSPTCRIRLVLKNPLKSNTECILNYPAWLMEEKFANEDIPRVLVTLLSSVSQIGRSTPGLVFALPLVDSQFIMSNLNEKCVDQLVREPSRRRSWDPLANPLYNIDLHIEVFPNSRMKFFVQYEVKDLVEKGRTHDSYIRTEHLTSHTLNPEGFHHEQVEQSLELLNFLFKYNYIPDGWKETINCALSFILYVKYNKKKDF